MIPLWQQRVLAERDETRARVLKLGTFIQSPAFDMVPQRERIRLTRQQYIMGAYLRVLEERIDNLFT
jgi:hypothetical protein